MIKGNRSKTMTTLISKMHKQGLLKCSDEKSFPKAPAFTLVELLVVIAIIALLMSILMPALAKVRKQAKAVLDLSNLRQWGIIWQMYTSDYDGYFNDGLTDSFEWMETIHPYAKDKGLYFCPEAANPNYLWWAPPGQTTTFSVWAWGYPSGERFVGSYGINEFCFNPPPSIDPIWGHPASLNWRHINFKGTGNIPMMVDASWAGGSPDHSNAPPVFEGEGHEGMFVDNMKRFCLNRHNGHVNGVFFDFSARKIGLKELWRLQWHKEYDFHMAPTGAELDAQAPWMKGFKDYD